MVTIVYTKCYICHVSCTLTIKLLLFTKIFIIPGMHIAFLIFHYLACAKLWDSKLFSKKVLRNHDNVKKVSVLGWKNFPIKWKTCTVFENPFNHLTNKKESKGRDIRIVGDVPLVGMEPGIVWWRGQLSQWRG